MHSHQIQHTGVPIIAIRSNQTNDITLYYPYTIEYYHMYSLLKIIIVLLYNKIKKEYGSSAVNELTFTSELCTRQKKS